MEEVSVNVEEIMEEVRQKIRAEGKFDMDEVMSEIEAEAAGHGALSIPPFSGVTVSPAAGALSAETISIQQQNRNEAAYLKSRYRISYFRELGGGPKGLAKRVVRKLGKSIVLPMREEQDDYNMHLATGIDGLRIAEEQLAAENAGLREELEQVKEAAGQVDALREELRVQREELRVLREELRVLREEHRVLREQAAEMQRKIAEQDQRQRAADKALDNITMSAARTIRAYMTREDPAEQPAAGKAAAEKPAPKAAEKPAAGAEEQDPYQILDYFQFENDFRGTQNEIMERQRVYVPFFRNRTGRIYDLGCGRGEFLRLMKEEGIPAFGMDMYPEFAITGKMFGLDIREGDGIALLEQSDEPLGGIFCAQVIEHIGFKNVQKLVKLAYDRLETDGYLVLETPNPVCVSAMTNAFYMDPTHDKPLHPLLMQYLLKAAGFRDVQLLYPDHSLPRLPHLQGTGVTNLEEVNRAVDLVSDLVFGSQDYAVAGRK